MVSPRSLQSTCLARDTVTRPHIGSAVDPIGGYMGVVLQHFGRRRRYLISNRTFQNHSHCSSSTSRPTCNVEGLLRGLFYVMARRFCLLGSSALFLVANVGSVHRRVPSRRASVLASVFRPSATVRALSGAIESPPAISRHETAPVPWYPVSARPPPGRLAVSSWLATATVAQCPPIVRVKQNKAPFSDTPTLPPVIPTQSLAAVKWLSERGLVSNRQSPHSTVPRSVLRDICELDRRRRRQLSNDHHGSRCFPIEDTTELCGRESRHRPMHWPGCRLAESFRNYDSCHRGGKIVED